MGNLTFSKLESSFVLKFQHFSTQEMIFAWNKFDVLNKSPELAKLHLATAWESVPSVLAESKGLYNVMM